MSQNSLLEEACEQLQHLRGLPATPMRLREITSLERLIASGAQPDRPTRTPRKKQVRARKSEDELDSYDSEEDEVQSSKPRKEIENDGTHRCVMISKKKPPIRSEKEEDEAFDRESKRRISNIKNAMGLTFRGFS